MRSQLCPCHGVDSGEQCANLASSCFFSGWELISEVPNVCARLHLGLIFGY